MPTDHDDEQPLEPMKAHTFLIRPSMKTALRREARRRDIPESQLIREALADKLSQREEVAS